MASAPKSRKSRSRTDIWKQGGCFKVSKPYILELQPRLAVGNALKVKRRMLCREFCEVVNLVWLCFSATQSVKTSSSVDDIKSVSLRLQMFDFLQSKAALLYF